MRDTEHGQQPSRERTIYPSLVYSDSSKDDFMPLTNLPTEGVLKSRELILKTKRLARFPKILSQSVFVSICITITSAFKWRTWILRCGHFCLSVCSFSVHALREEPILGAFVRIMNTIRQSSSETAELGIHACLVWHVNIMQRHLPSIIPSKNLEF